MYRQMSPLADRNTRVVRDGMVETRRYVVNVTLHSCPGTPGRVLGIVIAPYVVVPVGARAPDCYLLAT